MEKAKKTRVFAFGTDNDPVAWLVADALKKALPGCEFIKTGNPDDIASIISPGPPKPGSEAGGENEVIVIMDAARGIGAPAVLSIDRLRERQAVTAHDIDLGLTLKLLERSGRLKGIEIRIIGIPLGGRVTDGLVEKTRLVLSRVLGELDVQEVRGA